MMKARKFVTTSPLFVQRRIATLLSLLILFLLLLLGRVAWIQFIEGKNLTAKIQSQLADNVALQSPRGTIYDRNGRELAISSMAKSLYANTAELNQNPAQVASLLAPVLGGNAGEIKERLASGARFIWIKRTIDADVAQKVVNIITENNIKGLEFVEESKRYYPNDMLASHILGFVGTDDIGLEGIEMSLDKVIKGQQSEMALETDSHGIPIFKSIFRFLPHKQVKSVKLTIDSTIQFVVEQSLDKVMAVHKPRAVTVIIMNPRSGEILAMASRPGYNPNAFYKYSQDELKNRAVTTIYEPGSTFKSIVAAAGLQEGVVKPEDRFVDKGYIEVSGRQIKNWSGGSFGNISFLDAVKESINTFFAQVGLKLGAERLVNYAKAFGIGKTTGIELPGEVSGLLLNPADMRDSDVATMSIGQSVAVTPIQLITAISAIANDGVLLKPHIVKEIINADGTVEKQTAAEVVRQAIHSDTAHLLAEMMEKVVAEGGGKKAAIKGYRFAGKTGTAERLKDDGSGYETGHYIASFAGFGPVDDPQMAVLVMIDDPSGYSYYGGEIAAPVFNEIMSQVLRLLNIPPKASILAPAQPPAAGNAGQGKIAVPNLVGKNMRETAELLSQAGLGFRPAGTGIAVSQNIAPNTLVDPGVYISVTFEAR